MKGKQIQRQSPSPNVWGTNCCESEAHEKKKKRNVGEAKKHSGERREVSNSNKTTESKNFNLTEMWNDEIQYKSLRTLRMFKVEIYISVNLCALFVWFHRRRRESARKMGRTFVGFLSHLPRFVTILFSSFLSLPFPPLPSFSRS